MSSFVQHKNLHLVRQGHSSLLTKLSSPLSSPGGGVTYSRSPGVGIFCSSGGVAGNATGEHGGFAVTGHKWDIVGRLLFLTIVL